LLGQPESMRSIIGATQ